MHLRPFDRWWRMSVAIAVWPAFAALGTAVADEPYPGPSASRPNRPYEVPPRVLAADPSATRRTPVPNASRTVALQAAPKPGKKPNVDRSAAKPEDQPYKPASIRDIAVNIVQPPSGTEPDLRMIRYTPNQIAADDPIHFSSQPVVLTQLNGTFVDQRLSGPVSPFCFLPTYFEDDSLNRFGHSHGHLIQPVYSAAQFYVSVLMVPYQMQKRPAWDPVCPNYIPPPLTFRGKVEKFTREITLESVAAEAAAVATVFLVFP